MASYEANRGGSSAEMDDKEAQDARSNANNANNIRNAADVAIASKNPYAMAAGAAVKAADKITGGKSTDALAKGMTKANKMAPGGRNVQDASNKLSESGASDKIGQAARAKNAVSGGGQGGPPSSGAANAAQAGGNAAQAADNAQKAQEAADKAQKAADTAKKAEEKAPDRRNEESSSSDEESTQKKSGFGGFIGKSLITTVLVSAAPFFFIFILFFAAIATVSGLFGDYEDAIGMSNTLNEETGGVVFSASTPEQQAFYDRVNQVKLEYQAKGKTVDAMKIVAVFHVLNNNGAGIEYKDMTTHRIEQIADAMFDGNVYSEETFKQNLVSSIIPTYIKGLSQGQKEDIAKEVIDYIDRYNSLVGKEGFNPYGSGLCGGSNNCTYEIKGYYIHSKGNVNETVNLDNLYVRLMQCGTANGHNYGGTFGKPLEDEDLVPFEKYILGVAYQEIGDSAATNPKAAEAFKAQMVAARSYILARHADMGGWRTLKQEGDKWVLQAAACTQDQVYCDPDKGCSSNDGQWSMVYSGTSKAKKLRDPMPQDSPLRQYASETAGEVLVNSQGYIIYAGYKQAEQNMMSQLSNNGLNYKQILLQVYNQGDRNYGASDIKKNTCTNTGGTNCVSSGEFSQWRQGGQSWSTIPIGNSGKNIGQIGCLATSVSMLIAKSGVPTNVQGEFNPGTFVTYLNSHGGFDSGGNFVWGSVTSVAPSWKYQGKASVSGLTRQQKLAKIQEIISQPNTYAVAEVKGNTGQHWVAIDSVSGSTVNMMDPSSNSTDMWGQYNWVNTSIIASFKVS